MTTINLYVFTAGGEQLSKHLTVCQAIQRRRLMLDEDDEEVFNGSCIQNDGNHYWDDVFTITYQKADNQGTCTSLNIKSDSYRSISEAQGVSLLDSILCEIRSVCQ
jgi:E3 ubiquitin-protein ligase TRIP12